MQEEILGVKIDNLTFETILKKIESFLQTPKFHQIVTLNPEFILEAQKNPIFKDILNAADLGLADGFGLNLAFWKKGKRLLCRLPGVDLLEYILSACQRKNLPVFLICREDGLSHYEEIKLVLEKKYPLLNILGGNYPCQSVEIGSHIPDDSVLICNFGAPKQEILLFHEKNDKIRLAIGVGGTFDYYTGKVSRAPRCFRKCGLEWLWRLKNQPNRFKRIGKATFLFTWKIIFN